ncbi:hypothetical protein MKX03_032944 [Papaver bracteatum]|nr:hypothetical protein MKX03_032944 [Papaver bracteatum]
MHSSKCCVCFDLILLLTKPLGEQTSDKKKPVILFLTKKNHFKRKNSTWLKKADLLFVDNPVGTGYSFVEDDNAYVRTDDEAATDLTTLLRTLFNGNEQLQKSPLYVVAESYGGKYAVTLGLSIVKAMKAGHLKLKFGGVALGDSWISPQDYVNSWGPLLKDLSRLDNN